MIVRQFHMATTSTAGQVQFAVVLTWSHGEVFVTRAVSVVELRQIAFILALYMIEKNVWLDSQFFFQYARDNS